MAEQDVVRRLAAILATDVVGYSRLMAADEEGTLARLNALRREFVEPAITEHRGRVVKRTGDGLLVEFGSAVDATRCAVRIQQEMAKRNKGSMTDRRIEMRIGIHIGDVIVDEDDIFGDGVNVAARLESIARPGAVAISEDTWRQVTGRIAENFADIGEQRLKNIPRPVRVYQFEVGDNPPTRSLPVAPKVRAPAAATVPAAPVRAPAPGPGGRLARFICQPGQDRRLSNLLRFFLVPLIALLAVHYAVVDKFGLGNEYLWVGVGLVTFVSGLLFVWLGGSGIRAGIRFAVPLGLLSVAGMAISQSLDSGRPIMPQTHLEWLDDIHLAVGIALGYLIGCALARALQAMRSQNVPTP